MVLWVTRVSVESPAAADDLGRGCHGDGCSREGRCRRQRVLRRPAGWSGHRLSLPVAGGFAPLDPTGGPALLALPCRAMMPTPRQPLRVSSRGNSDLHARGAPVAIAGTTTTAPGPPCSPCPPDRRRRPQSRRRRDRPGELPPTPVTKAPKATPTNGAAASRRFGDRPGGRATALHYQLPGASPLSTPPEGQPSWPSRAGDDADPSTTAPCVLPRDHGPARTWGARRYGRHDHDRLGPSVLSVSPERRRRPQPHRPRDRPGELPPTPVATAT